MGLGMATAFTIVDVTIVLPHDCFLMDGSQAVNVLSKSSCTYTQSTPPQNAFYEAPSDPVPTVLLNQNDEWSPVNPKTDFWPDHDVPMHAIDPNQQYEVWRSKYGRPYQPTEKKNFLDFNAGCMSQNQDANRSWTAGCTAFAFMSDREFQNTMFADNAAFQSKGQRSDNGSSVAPGRRLLQTVPTSFTWVGTGKLTPVKDQGQCGSCYAHSTSSQMEAAVNIKMGSVNQMWFAREQLKACAGGGRGCSGGYSEDMFLYVATNGIASEVNYPYYWNQTLPCKSPLPAKVAQLASPGYTSIPNDELSLKSAVLNGPVVVSIDASKWASYAGGVFTSCGTSTATGHSVIVVGYGTDPTSGMYWLIQNSWGTAWGERGFIRITRTDARRTNNLNCAITMYNGLQATGGTSLEINPNDCQGYWSAWSSCSQSCGTTGTQSSMWTTTKPAGVGGLACPSPTTRTQPCNIISCPAPPTSPTIAPPTPAFTGAVECIKVKGSSLSTTGDGWYRNTTGWNQNYCGQDLNKEYMMAKAGQYFAVSWYKYQCKTTGSTQTQTSGWWGLGKYPSNGTYYQKTPYFPYPTPVVGTTQWSPTGTVVITSAAAACCSSSPPATCVL